MTDRQSQCELQCRYGGQKSGGLCKFNTLPALFIFILSSVSLCGQCHISSTITRSALSPYVIFIMLSADSRKQRGERESAISPQKRGKKPR